MGKAPQESYEWFNEARFGMFIHYGLYALLGRHEWALCYERIPLEEYRLLANRFKPENLDLGKWVEDAKSFGMRYMCLTTRHHDGFSLFDTQVSDYNSVKKAAGRDIVKEYTDACRAGGLGVGLYYSVADWSDPGFIAGPKQDPEGWEKFVNTAHSQLRELMTNYCKIDYLFYDGCPPVDTWGAEKINAEIRELQPGILLSDRCGLDEDIKSAEQHTIGDPGKPWESCFTTNKSWGWNYGDPDWKTSREVILTLMTTAHNGGNFLLNVGPKPDGTFPEQFVEIMQPVGEWVKANAEAVYGTKPHPFDFADQKLSTYRDQTAYITFHFNHGSETVVAGIGNTVEKVRIVATGEDVEFTQEGDRILLTGLKIQETNALPVVVALELDGPPKGIPNVLLSRAKYE